MDFFVLPKELEQWIGHLLIDPAIWVTAWDARTRAYSTICDLDHALMSKYNAGEICTGMLFYIGNRSIINGPVMRTGGDGRPRIDFQSSLSIQIIPSFVKDNVLLKGSIGALSEKYYQNMPGEKKFSLWKRSLYRSFTNSLRVRSVVATQILSNGTIKEWKNIILSEGAIVWHTRGNKMKEFYDGPVEFSIRLSE